LDLRGLFLREGRRRSEKWDGERGTWGGNDRGGNSRGPKGSVHTWMSEIMKNTLIAELI